MKERIKVIWTVLLVVCLLIGSTTSSYAADIISTENLNEGQDSEDNIVISEYDLFKSILQKTDSELKDKGYSNGEIEELRGRNPQKELKELSQKSTYELRALGYDEERIETIHSVKDINEDKISDEIMRVAWAKVTLTLKKESYQTTGTLTKGTTNAKLKATWKWDLCPSTTYIDKLVFSWGKPLASKNAEMTINHYSKTGDLLKTTGGTVAEKDPNHGCAFDINFIAGVKNGGTASISLYSTQQALKNIECKVTYGHSMVTITPSVSWNGASVSFDTRTKNMGSETITLG